jgi:alkanesulfonate monooxygenase SsuD/methylene tetrahydromethanopterin reductase-like flavin-dependent oxidoreductase (luciferase family)
MKVGISLTSGRRVTNPRDGARWMIERTVAARQSGLDSLFVGDHHSTGIAYYQNIPIMGRLLAEWGDAPAGCLFLLPLWNPVLVAEQVGTLASIAQGRFILQCGIGDDPRQFDAMGANIKHRPSAFEECFGAAKRLLAGERVTFSGKRYQFEAAKVDPRPEEPVEYWVGASAKVAIDRAVRLGDGWLAAPNPAPAQAKEQVDYYLKRCKDEGRTPSAVAIRRDVYVGESGEQARAVAEPIIAAGYRGFDPAALTYGSPDEVAAKFRELGEMGYTDIIVRHITDDQELVLGSLRRLKEVRVAVG